MYVCIGNCDGPFHWSAAGRIKSKQYVCIYVCMYMSVCAIIHTYIHTYIQDMDLEKNTLVVFTSDNGHEMGAGTGSVYREGKRSLMVRDILGYIHSYACSLHT